MSDDDKTEYLLKKALTGEKLTDEQAEVVADRAQDNTDRLQSLEKVIELEPVIVEMAENYKKIKGWLKWIAGLLVVNYGATFRDTISQLLN